ncbi:MAG: putative DnaK suppressor protein [Bacteroidota bacterium]|jgi:RNA polymerase-binding transcription factor DksA|nr:putative DnaK suppressor protein [Bacteroidota bacterium]
MKNQQHYLKVPATNLNISPSSAKPKSVRYSDSDLMEFKDLILNKLNESKKEYALLREILSHKTNNGTDDTCPTYNVAEDVNDAIYKEEVSGQALRLQKYIEHLTNALIRIENKTYGICSVTGELIAKERLRAVPHSTLSINAKLGNASR